jgi:hypothetical protein
MDGIVSDVGQTVAVVDDITLQEPGSVLPSIHSHQS